MSGINYDCHKEGADGCLVLLGLYSVQTRPCTKNIYTRAKSSKIICVDLQRCCHNNAGATVHSLSSDLCSVSIRAPPGPVWLLLTCTQLRDRIRFI